LRQLEFHVTGHAGIGGTEFAFKRVMPTKQWSCRIKRCAAITIVGMAAASCQEQNYRTEVEPGGQGHVELTRVPNDKPPAPADAPAAQPIDPQLADLEGVWPKLSPADRTTVVDLAKRLANSPP
jgi:hypothetical protein